MYRTSFLIDRRGMCILHYSLFLSYIMYCAEIWGNTYAANLKCLVLLQKKVVRLICRGWTTHVDLLKLPDVMKPKSAEIVYKALNN